MQPSPSSWRSALRAAFPHTVPILAGFLVLGATYGMLMQAIGYGPLWSGLFSAIAFGGSTQYAAVPLLAAGFDPLEVFLLSLTISARHLFYSVSMLKKYDDLGWKRWMLYYTLCDETFSVVSTVEPPEGVDTGKFYLSISLLNWSYWIMASMLGGVLGGVAALRHLRHGFRPDGSVRGAVSGAAAAEAAPPAGSHRHRLCRCGPAGLRSG